MNYKCLQQQSHPVECNHCGSEKHFAHQCPETNPNRCQYCRNIICDCGKKYFLEPEKKQTIH